MLCPAVASLQEEADSRRVLHSVVAAEAEAQQIVVDSPDTDVLVLLFHHRPDNSAEKLFFLIGHTGKHTTLPRYIPVHQLYDKLSLAQMNILLPVHCITGCDTVSSFHGYGKAKAFKFIKEKADLHQSLKSLEASPNITKAERQACTNSLNKLHCKQAAKKVGPRKLPPTDDTFHQYVLRETYQLMMWRQADMQILNLPHPIFYRY